MLLNLKRLRTEAGMSQKALAEQIGVSQQSVNKYENHNIEPDIETLIRMAAVFHVSVDDLVGTEPISAIGESGLSAEEKHLIALYRHMDPAKQASLLGVAEIYGRK